MFSIKVAWRVIALLGVTDVKLIISKYTERRKKRKTQYFSIAIIQNLLNNGRHWLRTWIVS